MFPTGKYTDCHELFLSDFSSISWPPNTAQENQFIGDASLESNGIIIDPMGKGEQKISPVPEENDEHSNKKKLKAARTEIERKRRQEMADHHSFLRQLLPLEYIRGKRSLSDHVHESVRYIKDLEKNIKDLRIERDMLQKISNSNVVTTSSANSTNNLPNSVTISSCCGGFEVLITSALNKEEYPLSRVLKVMLEEGFNVTNYVLTQVNGMLVVIIKSEVDNPKAIDLNLLQQKLADSIN